MRYFTGWIIVALWWLVGSAQAQEPVLADLVIRGAQIVDGTGSPGVVGDLAIRGERIVALGKFNWSGNPRVIDGTGQVLAPGFIDLHSHSDEPITKPATRGNINFLLQGCTTVVTGNCGGGRVDVEKYLREIDEHHAGTNVAHLVPAGSVRQQAMGGDKRPPSPAELERMRQIVDEGMRAGAFGMSTGLIYTPGSFAETSELIELSRVVARYGGLYATHMRNENTRLLESIQETLRIGEEAGLRVHISHFKVSGKTAWGLAPEAVRMVATAREQGRQVTADQYPYIASSTSLAATVMPDVVRTTEQLQKVLADPAETQKLREQLDNALKGREGGKTLVIARYEPEKTWQGKDLAAISAATGKPVVDLILEIQRNGGARIVNFGMNEEEVRLIMQAPYVATASDGSAMVPDDAVPHPRSYGTFPRKIGRYALEAKIVTLEQAIRSASGLPADVLRLTDRGYLKSGYVADLVLFDPATFRDTATYDQPHQYATGAKLVLVQGKIAVENGRATGELAGRALRHSPGELKR